MVKGDLSISLTGVPNGTLVALQHWALESPAIFVLVSDQRLCATDDKRHLLPRVLRRERESLGVHHGGLLVACLDTGVEKHSGTRTKEAHDETIDAHR